MAFLLRIINTRQVLIDLFYLVFITIVAFSLFLKVHAPKRYREWERGGSGRDNNNREPGTHISVSGDDFYKLII